MSPRRCARCANLVLLLAACEPADAKRGDAAAEDAWPTETADSPATPSPTDASSPAIRPAALEFAVLFSDPTITGGDSDVEPANRQDYYDAVLAPGSGCETQAPPWSHCLAAEDGCAESCAANWSPYCDTAAGWGSGPYHADVRVVGTVFPALCGESTSYSLVDDWIAAQPAPLSADFLVVSGPAEVRANLAARGGAAIGNLFCESCAGLSVDVYQRPARNGCGQSRLERVDPTLGGIVLRGEVQVDCGGYD